MVELEALLKKFPKTIKKLNDGNNALKEAFKKLEEQQHTQSSEIETFSKKIQTSKKVSDLKSGQSK